MIYGITLNKLVDDILNDVYGGIAEDGYSRQQVMFKLFRWRELLLRRDIDRNDIDPLFVQSIIVTMALTSSTLPCGTQTCKVLRSTQKIPRLIRGKTNFVWTLESYQDDMTEEPHKSIYTPIFPGDKRWVIKRRTTSLMKYAYIESDYLETVNDKEARYLKFNGVFFDPREAARFSDCDGTPCYTNDDPFPISGDIADIIYAETLKEVKQAVIYESSTQKQAKEARADRVES